MFLNADDRMKYDEKLDEETKQENKDLDNDSEYFNRSLDLMSKLSDYLDK